MAGNNEAEITVRVFNEDFNKSMKEMSKETSKLNQEFKLQQEQMKLSATDAEKLAAKMDFLNQKHEIARRKVEEAERQYEAIKAQFGENSQAAQDMARRLNSVRIEEQQLANQISETNSQLIEQNSRLRRSSEAFGNVGDKMKSVGSTMSTGFTAPVLGGLALITESTDELRQDLAKLEANALTTGNRIAFMGEMLKKINAVAPDTNANIEGLSNLMQTSFSESGLSLVIDNLAGAAIRFSETLKFEGLADGLQETLATGAATGTFAELLERSGIVLDDFNAGLTESIKNGTQENYILETLAKTGLANVNEEFRKNNEELVKNREATLEFQTVMAELGNTLLPIITAVKEKVAELTEIFNSLSPSMQKTILIITGIVAAVGPLLMVIGSIATGIGAVLGWFAPLSIAIAEAGGIIAWLSSIFTALTGPIGITIAAVAGLIAIFIALYKNNEEFRNKVLEIWETIKNGFLTALNFIWGTVQSVMSSVMSFFKDVLGKIKGFWDENGNGILQIVNFAFSAIWTQIKMYMGLIKGIFEVIWPVISGVVKVVWGVMKLTIMNTLDLIMGAIQFFTKLLTGDWKGAFNTLKETAEDIMNNIVKIFKDIDLLQIGKDIIKGLINGIKSMIGSVKSAVTEFAGNIPDWAKKVLGIQSPSKVMIDVGEDTGEGAIVGLENKLAAARKIAANFAQSFIPNTAIDGQIAMQSSTFDVAFGKGQIEAIQNAFSSALNKFTVDLNGDVYIDGRVAGHVVAPHVKAENDFTEGRVGRFRGR